jgi:hypothetical protein
MMKSPSLLTVLLLFSRIVFAQCLTAPPPPVCLGTEPLAIDNETINLNTTKYFYGSTATFNSYTLNGGTLVVNGQLTIDKFYMDSGIIYIHPGAKLIIGSGLGSGLIFHGNSAIYNYGTCEIQRNLSLEGNYATAAKPNLVINATTSSVFKMANQYFVINNPFSRFVNKGYTECWGIITDPQTPVGAVCLGNNSITKMAILINKVANSYVVPTGNACVYVHQFSQFFGRLTSSTGLLACLGATHTSDSGCIPFGCSPNNWGSAQVFTNCNSCATLVSLSIQFSSFMAARATRGNKLSWDLNTTAIEGSLQVLRSSNGTRFDILRTLPPAVAGTHYDFTDTDPLPGNNFYMIKYISPQGDYSNTKVLPVFKETKNGIAIYPVPFDNKFTIHFGDMIPEKILLTDITGRHIKTRYVIKQNSSQVEVTMTDRVEPGIYIIHVQTDKTYMAQTILKK